MNLKRSPLFYVGDKYKLMGQLMCLFPKGIDSFFEPFVGGGTVFLNVQAKRYFLNDINSNIIKIHRYLLNVSKKRKYFFEEINKIIHSYNLSRSYREDVVPDILKKQWGKTYFARFNKAGYEKMKSDFNESRCKDPLVLYVLLIYGFNRMLRFNRFGNFNLPVGNVDFNKNVENALNDYFEIVIERNIKFHNMDFGAFLKKYKFSKNDFVYIDPPYLMTFSEYNKLWDKTNEDDLFRTIDWLNKKNIRFALSNVTHYNGCRNDALMRWMGKYNVHTIKSNYISYNNNSTRKNIKEVLITNYD